MSNQEKFFELISKDWTKEDWEQTSSDQLRYHISEWVDQGGNLSNMFVAAYEFENWMGW